MFSDALCRSARSHGRAFVSICLVALAMAILATQTAPLLAQGQPGSSNASQGQNNPNQQEAPPEAGGPNDNVGPYAIPAKKEPPPTPPPDHPKKIENMPDYSIRVDV